MKYQYAPSCPGEPYPTELNDRVAIAEEVLDHWGPVQALKFLPELKRIAASHNWRAEAAADVYHKTVRQFTTEHSAVFDRTTERSTEFADLSVSKDRTTEPVLQ